MSSLWPSTLKSLDDSLALLGENLGTLTAAKSVDAAAVVEQLTMAAESARRVRELLSSELPEASWQNREELDALIAQAQRKSDARALEQLCSRLLALAAELERGTIVHRRAHRLSELNQLRERAIDELRSQAALDGEALQTLPGPEADRWIEWACGLKEPQDAESLQSLRNGFAHLDDFVANLEANMWIAAGPSPSGPQPEPERSADTTLLLEEPSRPETTEFEADPRLPNFIDDLSLPAVASNTPAPGDATPPQTEEELQRTLAQERVLLASMMSLDRGPAHPLNEGLGFAEAFRETNAAPSATSAIETEGEEPRRRKWWPFAIATLLMFAALGTIGFRLYSNRAGNRPVEASERKIPEPARSNQEDKSYSQAGLSVASDTHTSSPVTPAQSRPQEQLKPRQQSAAPVPLAKTSPASQASDLHDAALPPPAAAPREVAMVKKEEAPLAGPAEMPGSIPGGLPKAAPNSALNVVTDIPVAVPKIAEKVRVSAGVAQGLLIHQVTPQYPPLAVQARVQGTVVFQAVIGKDGSVQNLRVLSGPSLLIRAATDAVRKWRYKPFYLNGEPVDADTQINVHFTLSGG